MPLNNAWAKQKIKKEIKRCIETNENSDNNISKILG